MSLQGTIFRINNSLISAFAVLDSWCDRDHSFLYKESKNGQIPYEVLREVLVFNDYTYTILKQSPDLNTLEGALRSDTANVDLFTIPEALKREGLRIFGELSEQEIRTLLREQLFNFLCLLDQLYDSRLNIASNQDSPCVDGLVVMKSVAGQIARLINSCEEEPETPLISI